MHINARLRYELESDAASLTRYKRRLKILCQHYGESLGGKAGRSNKFRPTNESLRRAYELLACDLNREHLECTLRTNAEIAVLKAIESSTGLNFYKSMWIVNRNIDLFCPTIGRLYEYPKKGQKIYRTQIMRGLAIEVDGTIHNRELKMKKDNNKLDHLQALGIGCMNIENMDVHSSAIRNTIKQLKTIPRLDSRAKKRLLRKIYVATLAYHASDEVMVSLYGPKFLQKGYAHD